MSNIANVKMAEDILTIALTGKVDSQNAAQLESDVLQQCSRNSYQQLVLDAEELQYISSAGLRVILKLKKANPEFKIINASSEVYEIFDMTGFATIMDISKALRKISVDGCEVIGNGAYGTVYRLDPDTIAKIYDERAQRSEIDAEIQGAKKAFLHGIPTAISYDIVQCNGRLGVVYELIASKNMTKCILAEPERIDELVAVYADLAKQIHETEMAPGELSDIKEVYKEKLRELRRWLTDGELAALEAFVDCFPERNTLIHGDLHTGNIMLQDGEPLLIDMGDVSVGHPLVELLGIYLIYVMVGRFNPQQNIRAFGMEYERWKVIWDKFIRSYFPGISEEELEKLIALLECLATVKELIYSARYLNPDVPESAAGFNRHKDKLLAVDTRELKKQIEEIEHLFQ